MNRKLLCNYKSLENEVVSNFVLGQNAIWLCLRMLVMRELYRKHSDDSSKLWILRRSCLDSKAEHFMVEELRYEST